MNKKLEYLYIVDNLKKYLDIIEKLKIKYIPIISNYLINVDELNDCIFLIGYKKPVTGLGGYLKVDGILKKPDNPNLYSELINKFGLVEIAGLYFLKFTELVNFNDIYNKKITLKDINTNIGKYSFPEIKFPKGVNNFQISQLFVSKIIKIIDDIFKEFIITDEKSEQVKEVKQPKEIKQVKQVKQVKDLKQNDKIFKSIKNISTDNSSSKSNNSDSSIVIITKQRTNKKVKSDTISDTESNEESGSNDESESGSDEESGSGEESGSNEESDDLDEEEYFRKQKEKEEKKAYTFKLDSVDPSKVVIMEIPILWIPCHNLKENILKEKLSKKILSSHYSKCDLCEVINNNRNELDLSNILITYKNDNDDEEMDSIIKYYKFCKRYVFLKSDLDDYNYNLEKTNLLYYRNKFEKVYNECIFIVKLKD